MYKQNLAPIITLVVSDIKATALEKLYPLLSNDDLRAVKRNSDRYYYPNRTTGQQAVGQSGRPTSRTSLLLNSVNDNEKEQLFALVMEYADVLSLSSSELGRTTVLKHRINTGDSQPVHLPPRRIPQARREEVRRLIQEMLDQGVIQHSDSPWSSPVVLAKKKDGSLRFCVDYRKVNEVTKKDAYPLPRRLIDRVLSGLKWSSCLVYLDDIIVQSATSGRNVSRFLGHIVSADGIATDPSKTAAVKNWPIPQSRREVQQFLGLANYYRRFVGNFASIAKPLQQLTEKNSNFEWTVECQCAFDELRACLISPPVLSYPDYSRLFILDTDASDIGIGAVLSQVRENGSEGVVAYASRSLSRPERRYCVTRKELLAVGEFVHHFRQYLLGREFTLRTDHGSLVWVRNFKEPEGQLARWRLGGKGNDLHLVLPTKFHADVLQSLHEGSLSAHLGEEKMLHQLKERFYWPGSAHAVREYCATCVTCCTRKSAAPKRKAELQTIQAGYPLQVVCVDIMGPLPETEEGSKYVLVAVDYFTRWVEAYGIPNQEATTVGRKLVDEMFCRFSPPVSS
eukprot:Em0193g7a